MAASTTDRLHKTGAATKTTLAAPGKALAATSINVVSTTNWPTDTQVTLAIRKVQLVDGEYEEVAGSYAEFNGIVSGTTITNLALVYGTDQVYPSGTNTEVFLPVSAYAHNRMVDGILIGHNQNGTHKSFVESAIVPTAAIQDSAVTSAKINMATMPKHKFMFNTNGVFVAPLTGYLKLTANSDAHASNGSTVVVTINCTVGGATKVGAMNYQTVDGSSTSQRSHTAIAVFSGITSGTSYTFALLPASGTLNWETFTNWSAEFIATDLVAA